jgi:hypothetical protein
MIARKRNAHRRNPQTGRPVCGQWRGMPFRFLETATPADLPLCTRCFGHGDARFRDRSSGPGARTQGHDDVHSRQPK